MKFFNITEINWIIAFLNSTLNVQLLLNKYHRPNKNKWLFTFDFSKSSLSKSASNLIVANFHEGDRLHPWPRVYSTDVHHPGGFALGDLLLKFNFQKLWRNCNIKGLPE